MQSPCGLLVATLGTRSVKCDFGEDLLGAWMFWSSFDSATNQRLVEQAGLRILHAEKETAVEFGALVKFLWVVAQKPGPER